MRMGLFGIILLTFLCVSGASKATETHNVHFSVVSCGIFGPQADPDWLEPGVAFDIEKRLGRWPGFESAEHLRVHPPIRVSGVSFERQSLYRLFDSTDTNLVIILTGELVKDDLNLKIRVYKDTCSAPKEIEARGKLPQLFSLDDELMDALVPALKDVFPGLSVPGNRARFHLAPSKSIDAYASMIRGMKAVQCGDVRQGRDHLSKALVLDPRLWWAYYFFGSADFQEGNFADAAEHCRTAIAFDPDLYPAIYANLAYCYEGLRDAEHYAWAKAEFERRAGKPLPQRSLPSRIAAPTATERH
jgi:hypothetical protein